MPKYFVKYKSKFTGAVYSKYFDSIAFAMKYQSNLNKEIYCEIVGDIIYDLPIYLRFTPRNH